MSLGTGLTFTAVRVVGAPKGCRRAYVTTHEGRRIDGAPLPTIAAGETHATA